VFFGLGAMISVSGILGLRFRLTPSDMFCYVQVTGMVLTRVKPWENVKKYEDEMEASEKSMDLLSGTSFSSDGAEKVSKGKGQALGKGKAKVDPKLQVAIGDDFEALRKKIDFTGFIDPSHAVDSGIQAHGHPQPLPGIAELELADAGAVGSHALMIDVQQHENAMHPVGDESENFASGSVADVLLPNEMDFLPKGVTPSPTSTVSSSSRMHSPHAVGETSCTIPAHINLEERGSMDQDFPNL